MRLSSNQASDNLAVRKKIRKNRKISNETENQPEKKRRFSKIRQFFIPIDSYQGQILGTCLLTISVFYFICLISYNDLDPSFNVHSGPLQNINNYSGLVGAVVSDLSFQVLGLASFGIVFILSYFSFLLLFRSKNVFRPFIIGGPILLLICVAVLLGLFWPTFTTAAYTIKTGGVIGALISTYLKGYLNVYGTLTLMAGLLFISLYITFRFSLFLTIKGSVKWLFNFVKGFLPRKLKKENSSPEESKLSPQVVKPAINSPTPKIAENIEPPQVKRRDIITGGRPMPKPPKKKAISPHLKPGNQPSLYQHPSISLFKEPPKQRLAISQEEFIHRAGQIEDKLRQFGVDGKIVQVNPGPVVTVFEFEPGEGVRYSRISNLSEDLALALKASSIRIDRIPGKNVLGIEVPNAKRHTVYIRDVISSLHRDIDNYRLPMVLGKDIEGGSVAIDLAAMPHLLVAGATGTGKSVTVNSMLCSLLMKAHPGDVKLILIDPKMLEFSMYENIPHLLLPVVIDVDKASAALRWAVVEMERRYKILKDHDVRSIDQYRQKRKLQPTLNKSPDLPYIVIIIDELADLMMVAPKDVEDSIMRIAQKARAAGIHLLLATQRPSVNVITGVIKANLPSRISCKVTSKIDSRTILDCGGAESLLGKGDMLYSYPGVNRLKRVHGAFVGDDEVLSLANYLRSQKLEAYDQSTINEIEAIVKAKDVAGDGSQDENGFDEKYDEAVAITASKPNISVSALQRHMQIGFNRASRIIDKMESEGVVGPAKGAKPRDVLIS